MIRSRWSPAASCWNPRPSTPSRFSAGTGHSSKLSSAVSEARIPILSSFRLTENPGRPRSTRNIEMPSCRRSAEPSPVRAATK